MQRQAKSTVFTLGYYTHQLVFISIPSVAPPAKGLQLESASLKAGLHYARIEQISIQVLGCKRCALS